MENVIIENNVHKYYLNGELLLTITAQGDNNFTVENRHNKYVGYCKKISDNETEYRLDKNYTIGKNGRLYNSKKLIGHNGKWFAWILKEKGFLTVWFA